MISYFKTWYQRQGCVEQLMDHIRRIELLCDTLDKIQAVKEKNYDKYFIFEIILELIFQNIFSA